jgi:hypothetical protein
LMLPLFVHRRRFWMSISPSITSNSKRIGCSRLLSASVTALIPEEVLNIDLGRALLVRQPRRSRSSYLSIDIFFFRLWHCQDSLCKHGAVASATLA